MRVLPIEEDIVYSLSALFRDSSQKEPSHFDIKQVIEQYGLSYPNSSEGKAKKVQAVLQKASLDNDFELGGKTAFSLCSLLRAKGGFRVGSKNYIGEEEIENFRLVLNRHSYTLSSDGYVQLSSLENLTGVELTKALLNYARRARQGIEDAALVVGTGKDLLEATMKHILDELGSSYAANENFHMLSGHCFMELGLETGVGDASKKEGRKFICIEKILYSLAKNINTLRNSEGTGHGRPYLPDLQHDESKVVIELVGVISEFLLVKLEAKMKATQQPDKLTPQRH